MLALHTPMYAIPRDWIDVLEAQATRGGEVLIARVFGDYDARPNCAGPVTSDDGFFWNCEWCGAPFASVYRGVHSRHVPRYLSDMSAALALLDELRQRDRTLEVEIDLCTREGCPKEIAQTRIYVARAVPDHKTAYLTRFVAANCYAAPRRNMLCQTLFEAMFEIYEISGTTQGYE